MTIQRTLLPILVMAFAAVAGVGLPGCSGDGAPTDSSEDLATEAPDAHNGALDEKARAAAKAERIAALIAAYNAKTDKFDTWDPKVRTRATDSLKQAILFAAYMSDQCVVRSGYQGVGKHTLVVTLPSRRAQVRDLGFDDVFTLVSGSRYVAGSLYDEIFVFDETGAFLTSGRGKPLAWDEAGKPAEPLGFSEENCSNVAMPQ